jgi:hypothetical protein
MFAYQLRAAFCATIALIVLGAAGCYRAPPAAPADTQWTTYADPGAPHAFTIEAPVGWQVAGGTQVISPVDTREGVVMRSPDGAIQLFLGDPALPVFAVPTPMLASQGLRAGSVFSPGPGLSLFVAPYVTGQQFAAQWGGFRVSRVCGQVALKSSRRLPQAAGAVDALYREIGLPGSVEAGDAGFTCTLPTGAAAAGYAFTATRTSPATTMTFWNVAASAGFIAPTDRVAEARALLAHVIESYRVEPAWLAKQRGMPADAAQKVVQSNAAIATLIRAPATFVALTAAQGDGPAPDVMAATPAAEAPPSAPPTSTPNVPGPAPQVAYAPPPASYVPPRSFGGADGAPPMDMSWAIQSQLASQAAGDAAVRNAYNSAYAMLAQARADGHPVEGQLVLGNHPNTFGDGGYAERSARTTRAIEDHTLRATRGCERQYEDSQGNRWYTC